MSFSTIIYSNSDGGGLPCHIAINDDLIERVRLIGGYTLRIFTRGEPLTFDLREIDTIEGRLNAIVERGRDLRVAHVKVEAA